MIQTEDKKHYISKIKDIIKNMSKTKLQEHRTYP